MTVVYTKVEIVEVKRNGWTKILEFRGFGQGSDVRIEEEGCQGQLRYLFFLLVKLDERQ